ncbi:NAD-dependent deacylase [Lysobacter sp. GX 14042]|uniref:SIR2 family NAD-dependent protein deacylase n=1 Tax=Lysobacter sp. GX 14042 TaxID=2907155 RepID=UPI001F45A5A4|nr:NAD-dependent deacylase [Lysobacter sp. GX 14042]MCE7031430.1 NAD-dependent deacylase [Lysobacter sp. GX 14042]
MSDEPALQEAAAALRDSARPVIFTGAGMSAESGIPTFRGGKDSLWSRWKPEELATPMAFQRDRTLVWGWYVYRMAQLATVQPHAGHWALAELQARWTALTVVTQNVDDLHERAGSSRVLHLHGELMKLRCSVCNRPFTGFDVPALETMEPGQRLEPPRCGHCDGFIRPGVVWFGESLPTKTWARAEAAIRGCDLLLVVGTSGQVEPAASLVGLARRGGARVILVDPDESAHAGQADLHLRGGAGAVLAGLRDAL